MRIRILAGLVGAMVGSVAAGVLAADSEGREIPEPLVPFEHMVGSWKGQGVPTANKLKGWGETHQWAWKFAKGAPVGLSVVLEGDKTLAKAELTADAGGKHYRLEGTDPAGKPVAYAGTYGGSSSSKMLTLERVGETATGKDRLVIWPYANKIRYALWVEHQEPGAPQFKRVIEVGLTKEGEAFAAGGSAADLPKCIITGGAATMTVSYQGKSFPLCCTGCRDEFNDNPEKYVKKAALRAEAAGAKAGARPAAASAGKDDGAFAGFDDAPAPKSKTPTRAKPAAAADPGEPAAGAAKAGEGATKEESRAAALLRIGENLEKSGKTATALQQYQRVVKEFAGTAAARTAAERVKALGGGGK